MQMCENYGTDISNTHTKNQIWYAYTHHTRQPMRWDFWDLFMKFLSIWRFVLLPLTNLGGCERKRGNTHARAHIRQNKWNNQKMTFKTIFIPIAHDSPDEMKRNEFNDVKTLQRSELIKIANYFLFVLFEVDLFAKDSFFIFFSSSFYQFVFYVPRSKTENVCVCVRFSRYSFFFGSFRIVFGLFRLIMLVRRPIFSFDRIYETMKQLRWTRQGSSPYDLVKNRVLKIKHNTNEFNKRCWAPLSIKKSTLPFGWHKLF